MKLSKVKKVCTDAGQLGVINVGGPGNNLVQQWVGTQEAIYPLDGITVTEEMLQRLWELSPAQIAKMAESPVMHDRKLLNELPGMIDKNTVEYISLGEVMGMLALKCRDGVIFVDPALLRPCGEWRNYVIVEDEQGPWVAVYNDGVLDGLVRPEKAKEAMMLHTCARSIAAREFVRWGEE